jgi:hypothetical protein
MMVAEQIIAVENGELFRKRVVELEIENSRLRATVAKPQGSINSSAETIATLQCVVDAGIEELSVTHYAIVLKICSLS